MAVVPDLTNSINISEAIDCCMMICFSMAGLSNPMHISPTQRLCCIPAPVSVSSINGMELVSADALEIYQAGMRPSHSALDAEQKGS